MRDFDAMLAACHELAARPADLTRVKKHAITLQEGISQLREQLEMLREQNKDLDARRESLEEQVMVMASEPIERVIEDYLCSLEEPEDDDDPDGVFEPAA